MASSFCLPRRRPGFDSVQKQVGRGAYQCFESKKVTGVHRVGVAPPFAAAV